MARKPNKKTNRKVDRRINNGSEDRKPELDRGKETPSPEAKASPEEKEKATNDVEWYSQDPDLLLNASNIPFSDVFGAPINIITPNGISGAPGAAIHTESTQPNSTEPGIVVLETASFFGDSTNRSSPLNVCANALYTHVRYANSGRKNYDPADLALYCIAMADVYSFINWARRVYNCAFMYSQRNQYIGKALLEAQGWDPNDLIENLVQFRYELNVFTNKVAAFAIPADIAVFKRKVFMYGSLYTESPDGNIKDQLYLFNPASFYRFELDSTSAGMLRSRSLISFKSAGRLTMTSFRNMMSWFLNDMWNNEDFGLMSGDILKAFEGKIIGLDSLPEEGGIIPIYDPIVLHQMKNASIVDIPIRGDSEPSGDRKSATAYEIVKGSNVVTCYNLDVMQDIYGNLISHAGYLIPMADAYPSDAVTYIKNPIISLDSAIADPAMVVESTRLMCTFDIASVRDARNAIDANVTAKVINVEAMTEIVTKCSVYGLNTADGATAVVSAFTNSVINMQDSDSAFLNYLRLGTIPKCTYMPMMYGVVDMTYNENQRQWELVGMNARIKCLSDLRNYTVQSQEVIRRLNNVALMSLLYVPGVAKQINVIK